MWLKRLGEALASTGVPVMLIVSACAGTPPLVSNGAMVDYGSLVAGLRAVGERQPTVLLS